MKPGKMYAGRPNAGGDSSAETWPQGKGQRVRQEREVGLKHRGSLNLLVNV